MSARSEVQQIKTHEGNHYFWLHAAFIESFIHVRSTQTSYKKLYKMDQFSFTMYCSTQKKTTLASKCKHRSFVSLAIKGHALSICLLPLLKCLHDSTYLEIEIIEGGQWFGKETELSNFQKEVCRLCRHAQYA